MKVITPESARAFVQAITLPAPSGYESAAAPVDFDALKDQAMVVGSDIVSFVRGVSDERRKDIVNSSLLAQLAANKKVPERSRILEWYDAYFDVLSNIGWAIQEKGFARYEEQGQGFTAHEAILSVAATVLGSSPAALALVTSTLKGLQSMDKDNPWITLFDRESKYAETARFQVSLAEQESDGQFLVSLMAFGLTAKSELTQVLFFKHRFSGVTLEHSSGKVTINEDVLSSVRGAIRGKLALLVNEYVGSIEI